MDNNAEVSAASTQPGTVLQIGDQLQGVPGRFAIGPGVGLRRSHTSARSQTAADAVDDMHPPLGSQREAVSADVSLHETADEILRRKSSNTSRLYWASRKKRPP